MYTLFVNYQRFIYEKHFCDNMNGLNYSSIFLQSLQFNAWQLANILMESQKRAAVSAEVHKIFCVESCWVMASVYNRAEGRFGNSHSTSTSFSRDSIANGQTPTIKPTTTLLLLE